MGYWRRWERETGWLMREIVFAMISISPHIKSEDKPKDKRDILKLSVDPVKEIKKAPSKKEVQKAENKIKNELVIKPDSKNNRR